MIDNFVIDTIMTIDSSTDLKTKLLAGTGLRLLVRKGLVLFIAT